MKLLKQHDEVKRTGQTLFKDTILNQEQGIQIWCSHQMAKQSFANVNQREFKWQRGATGLDL